MGRPYSNDLRERAVGAVLHGGLSRHRAAAQFGVGVSTVVNWVRRFHETGSVGAGPDGRTQAEGDPRRARGLSVRAHSARSLHAARAGGGTRRARAQGRLSLGVEFRPRGEAQFQKKASWRASANGPTSREGGRNGRSVRTRSSPSVWCSLMRPGRRPIWSRFAAGRRGAKGWWPALPTAIGKP